MKTNTVFRGTPPVLMLVALAGTLIGCQDDITISVPEITGIAPASQFEGEPTPVTITGRNFFAKLGRNPSNENEFHADDTFVVRLFDISGSTGVSFDLLEVNLHGETELTGMTTAAIAPGLYSVTVEDPFGKASAPLENAYSVHSLESRDTAAVDADTALSDTDISDTRPTEGTDSDTDSQRHTDTEPPSDTPFVGDTESTRDTGTPPGSDIPSASESNTAMEAGTDTSSATDTATGTGTETVTATATATATETATATVTATASASASATDTASCDDGVQNQDETGVDCGGSICPPCPCTSWTYSAPEPITGLGLSADVYSPALSADGLTMYVSANDGTGEIYVATRDDRGTVFHAAGTVSEVSTPTSDESTPYLTADGLSLYFQSTRTGSVGGRDIMVATRLTASSPFSAPTFVTEVNSIENDHLPWVSADQLTMLFVSTRFTPLAAGANLWIATRGSVDDPFGDISALPASLNTDEEEGRAAMTDDGLTLYFTSESSSMFVDLDIWVATRQDTGSDFGTPESLLVLNSVSDDRDVTITQDGTEIFFSSGRGGGDARIYRSLRACADGDTATN